MSIANYLLFYSLTFFINCTSQLQVSRIKIVQPSIEQEATSIWRTINDITFLEKQGYNINLPKDSLIDTLIIKSKNGTFGNEDFSAIYSLLETKFFHQRNYEKAKQKVEPQIKLLNELINEIDAERDRWDWKFKIFDTYKVVFTLYGTGGSYDPDEGIITLLTNEEGGFMNYENPANTIIHEIVHIGLEESIILRYQVPHGLKERIVDTFVDMSFSDELPEYSVQDTGEYRSDQFLNTPEDLIQLDKIVAKILSKN